MLMQTALAGTQQCPALSIHGWSLAFELCDTVLSKISAIRHVSTALSGSLVRQVFKPHLWEFLCLAAQPSFRGHVAQNYVQPFPSG